MSRYRAEILLSALVALTGAVFGLSQAGLAFEEQFGLDWLFRLRGSISAPADVAVVTIAPPRHHRSSPDDGGVAERLPPSGPRQRDRYAKLIDALVAGGASAIVLDLRLNARTQPDEDAALAAAIARARRVVLFQALDVQRSGDGDPRDAIEVLRLISPADIFAEPAAGIAPFPLPRVPARVSQFWAFVSAAGGPPTMPVVALQLQALDGADHFARILENAGLSNLGMLSREAAALRTSRALAHLSEGLRAAFKADDRLAERLLRALAQAGESISSRDRQGLAALVRVYGGDDAHYLNLYGPPGTIRTLAMGDVIGDGAGSPSPAGQGIAGATVFVGFSELERPDQRDAYHTVFSGGQGIDLSGVEIAATAYGNLITNRTLRLPNTLVYTAVLAGFGAVAGFLAAAVVGERAAAAVILWGVVFVGLVSMLFNRADLWFPVAIPSLVQSPLAVLAGLLLQSSHIRRAIKMYVPSKVANWISAGRDAPKPALVYGVCLSTDVEHYTGVAERLAPLQLTSLMNDYFAMIEEQVRHHHGEINDFTADQSMSVWTGTAGDCGMRLSACRAAIAIRAAGAAFDRAHPESALPTRIGLHAGPLAQGHVGGTGHLAFHIVGDIANTASRMQSLNKRLGTRMLASETVVGDLETMPCRRLGLFQLPGKREAVRVYELLMPDERDSKLRMRQRFDEALVVFEAGDWRSANSLFHSLLAEYPQDGPCRFYARLTEGHDGPATIERPVIVSEDAALT